MAVGGRLTEEDCLKTVDPEIKNAIAGDLERQQFSINLIASENLASKAILEAQGSILTNKYAEGYPGARYYGGCEFADMVESLACKRAVSLFHADHANVQPHAGASANLAVYLASLESGAPVLAMDLYHGGHLTHGSPVNFSGKYYHFYHYGVDAKTGLIDMNQVEEIARRVRPRMIVAGASAYPRVIDFENFARIAAEVNALFTVDMAHIAGLVAAKVHPSPIPHADFVTSTTHKTLRGPRGGLILCRAEHARAVDKAVFPGVQGGPLVHVIAAKAVAFKEASMPDFVQYQRQVVKNAKVLAKSLAENGFQLISGGTDNHMILIDMRSKGITGKEMEKLLGRVGITANKNAIPFDPQGPVTTSGLRVGTPAVTTRGMKEEEMVYIAFLMNKVVENRYSPEKLAGIGEEVEKLCARFPIYL